MEGKKFKLKSDKGTDLTLFMFIIKGPEDDLPSMEVLYGYDQMSALDKVRTFYDSAGYMIDPVGKIEIEELLEPIEGFVTAVEDRTPKVNENQENFIFNLRYMADQTKKQLTSTERLTLAKAIGKLEKDLKKVRVRSRK